MKVIFIKNKFYKNYYEIKIVIEFFLIIGEDERKLKIIYVVKIKNKRKSKDVEKI